MSPYFIFGTIFDNCIKFTFTKLQRNLQIIFFVVIENLFRHVSAKPMFVWIINFNGQ